MSFGKANLRYFSSFYDKYAGALYGIILRIVKKEVIADKILEKAFKADFKDRHNGKTKLLSEFSSISQHARKKSTDILKAIKIFEACNNGSECVDPSKYTITDMPFR